MGLPGKIKKRKDDEVDDEDEDLDFDEETVDSLDNPDDEGGSGNTGLGKVF